MNSLSNDIDPVANRLGVLATWKGIAAHFGCNVRTAKRWERERGLPVHRAPGKRGSTVFAHVSELNAWLELRKKEPGLGTDQATSVASVPINRFKRNHFLFPMSSSAEHAAKQSWLFDWRAWALAGSILLIAPAALFWKAQSRRTVAAGASTQIDSFNGKPHVPAPGAEELFLRGRFFWNLRTAGGLAKAMDAYTQAIVADPSYAEAYAGLAETYDLLPQFGQADMEDSLRKAEAAADRAIVLNPNLAAAHRAKGFALFYWDWDIAGSDAEFQKALRLEPGSADTHQWYASTLQCRGEGTEAVRQIDEAVRLRPMSAAIAADAAYFHADFGNFESGVRALREIEQTQPTLATPADFLRKLDFAVGDYPDYITDARRYASITRARGDEELAGAAARGWARAGRTGLLEERAQALKADFDRGHEQGFQLGETLLMLGEPKKALAYFNAALDQHAIELITMQACPWAKGLSRDPGYASLFAQIHARLHDSGTDNLTAVPISRQLPLRPIHLQATGMPETGTPTLVTLDSAQATKRQMLFH